MNMKKILAAAFSAAAFAALAETSTPEGWTDDYDAALERAAKENKLILADFSGSDWCCWCQRLDKEVFDTPEFKKSAPEKYVLLFIDSPNDASLLSEKAAKQNRDLTKKYRIRGFPSVLILNAKGEVLHKTGYAQGGPVKYLEALDAELDPEIRKYIKPIEEILARHDDAFKSEMMAITRKVLEKFPVLSKEPTEDTPREEIEKLLQDANDFGETIAFDEVAPKFLPLFEKDMADARAQEVPEKLAARKAALIAEHQKGLDMLKQQKADWDAKKAPAAK